MQATASDVAKAFAAPPALLHLAHAIGPPSFSVSVSPEHGVASTLGLFGRAAPMLAYTAPTTVEEAVRALAGASGVAKVLSGGTDLLVQLRSGRAKPDLIVDIKRIPDMSGIRERDGGFALGAATSGAVIGEHAGLRQAWPGVVEAANLIGSTQV